MIIIVLAMISNVIVQNIYDIWKRNAVLYVGKRPVCYMLHPHLKIIKISKR